MKQLGVPLLELKLESAAIAMEKHEILVSKTICEGSAMGRLPPQPKVPRMVEYNRQISATSGR
jgi:hypothetical protein